MGSVLGGLPLNGRSPGISAGAQTWLVVTHGESREPWAQEQQNCVLTTLPRDTAAATSLASSSASPLLDGRPEA